MFYLVGLGNPGEKYANTRHNIGWLILDTVRDTYGFSSLHQSSKFSGQVAEGQIGSESVTMLYPETFMNNSGSAVAKLVPKKESGNLIVIHDDIDLPFGEIKIGKGKGAGGNNGVASVIQKLGTKDFIRIRVGIAPRSFWTKEAKRPKGGGPLERFVLKPFTKREEKELADLQTLVTDALKTITEEGIEAAMNKHH